MTVEGLLATINQDRLGSVLKFLQTNLMVLTIAGLVCLVVDKSILPRVRGTVFSLC